jgi:Ser-tRNA(Ala) deacylase AlaX
MATKLLYLDKFDVYASEAKVESITKTDDERMDIVLDQTCFYPRGGGQDWDMGAIADKDSDARFSVEEVRLDETGTVHHIGHFTAEGFIAEASVGLRVDTDRRIVNTKLHSAGHVVDMAVDKIGLGWLPTKGAHYPHMSFVEYDGEEASKTNEDIQSDLQQVVDAATSTGNKNEIRFMSVEEMHTVCRNVPDNIPTNKPARVVVYDGNFGVPCGGTHVASLDQIGHVTITKIKSKKGSTKISYAVEGIN